MGRSRLGDFRCWSVVLLLVLMGAPTACSTSVSTGTTDKGGAGGDATSGTARYEGTGTLTLSKDTVANECSSPVEATLVVYENDIANLTLDFLSPISDQVNEPGKESVFVCTDNGIPRNFEYSGRGVDGQFVFENPPLVTGNLELVVDADGASLSGVQDGLGNLHHWSVELEPVS